MHGSGRRNPKCAGLKYSYLFNSSFEFDYSMSMINIREMRLVGSNTKQQQFSCGNEETAEKKRLHVDQAQGPLWGQDLDWPPGAVNMWCTMAGHGFPRLLSISLSILLCHRIKQGHTYSAMVSKTLTHDEVSIS